MNRVDVAIVVPPRTLLLDVAGPAEAFRLADTHLADQGRPERFRLRFVGPQAQAASSVGLQVAGLEALPTRFSAPRCGASVSLCSHIRRRSRRTSPISPIIGRSWRSPTMPG